MAFLTRPGMLALLRNRLRLNDVILSMSSLLVVLRDLSVWFSIFDTAHLTDLGSKTGYRRLTSLKMSINLFIHLSAVSILITILRLPNVESGRRPIIKIIKFYSGCFVLVHVRISQCEF